MPAATIEIALVEWPPPGELGGPRLIGRLYDPDLITEVRERLLAAHRRELARLGAHLESVPPAPEDDLSRRGR